MPTGAPKIITPPCWEPISVAEAQAQCRVTSDYEKPLLDRLIQTAREKCEEDLGIAVPRQTLEQVLDCFPDGEIRLSRPPLLGVGSITYFTSDGTQNILSASEYLVDYDGYPGRIVPKYGYSWPTGQLQPINGIRILFDAGWPNAKAVPALLKSGMLLIIGSLFKNREADVSGTSLAASVPVNLDSKTQSAVDSLWRRYKRKL